MLSGVTQGLFIQIGVSVQAHHQFVANTASQSIIKDSGLTLIGPVDETYFAPIFVGILESADYVGSFVCRAVIHDNNFQLGCRIIALIKREEIAFDSPC